MDQIIIPRQELSDWGTAWLGTVNATNGKTKSASAFDRQQSVNFASFIDMEVGKALAKFLGGINVVTPHPYALLPPEPDCVEVGPARIIGGIRPQNFDVAYRPDGPRIVFDSKSLNDQKSIGKNWQNMVNDLGTEAATVHTRFPYAIVAFMVVLPKPAVAKKQEADLVRTLERLGNRKDVLDQAHLAEALSLILWDPQTGDVCPDSPPQNSSLRLENFSRALAPHYIDRYKGLPPHE
ncbi:hypothetical protein DX908_13225 [Parvularcula marina]|uniref:Restriction endonuclease n=2 Tax=Parvularcula marina TaxID=2292771 RepID=A0A371RM68_9PROT|nr:hypothetical protein DX908_13225 [Parvularcula marina]